MKKFAVFGKPILHSKSPDIYNFLFKKNHFDAYYTRIFAETGEEVLELGGVFELDGANITSPLKKNVAGYCHNLSPESKITESVNTILYKKNIISGFNTDVFGVAHILKEEVEKNILDNKTLTNKKIAIVGAGGAAEAAALALLENTTNNQVYILNRTDSKSLYLANKYKFKYISSDLLSPEYFYNYDLIIITIPNPQNNFSKINFSQNTILIFADYRDKKYFNSIRKNNTKVISGYNWLAYQAISAYEIYKAQDENINYNSDCNCNQNYFTDKKENLLKIIDTEEKTNKKNLYLIGFSGAGKSTIGAKLASALKLNFIDLDKLVEEFSGKSIQKIFTKNGEDSFRKMEEELLNKLINSTDNSSNKNIISLGAGANINKLSALKNSGRVIYLYSTLEESLERIKNNSNSRPKLQNLTYNEISNIYNMRKEKYFLSSDFIIHSHKKVLENLLSELK